uniref:Lipid droplet-regulating VLDL assembly factor AUP1 n=1 Tax=Corvus moneduloides TaxID=1196302 RepID=A0A8C3DWQ1_CORMO
MGSCSWPCCSTPPWGSACLSCASSSASTCSWSAAPCPTASCAGAWSRGAPAAAPGGSGVAGLPRPLGITTRGGLAQARICGELCLRDSLSSGALEVLPLASSELAATSGVLRHWSGARGSAWCAAQEFCGHLLPSSQSRPYNNSCSRCVMSIWSQCRLSSCQNSRVPSCWMCQARMVGLEEDPCSPGRFIVRVMCSVLGLLVRQSDPRLRGAGARVFIANHVTPFDHNVVSLLTSCNTPALSGAPGFICWSRGFMELGVTGSRAELVDSLREYSAHEGNPPLLLFPEEAATNGRAGLLRFSSWPFSILDVVQPVALQVRRPLVAVSVADSSWIAELLWTFFVPFTVYQVRWMPSVPRQADERSEDFALRVQELLAVELGVVSTRITAADRTEHMKRLRHTSRLPFAPASSQRPAARPRVPPSLPGGAPEDVRVMAMAQQVKEVLPHVPLEVIRTDLVQTNCVDTTIANLLEGRVPFFPESKEAGDLPAPSTSQAAAASGIQGSVAAPSSKPATKQFAKSPVERHLSLQERKRALYDYARRRFAEKHGAARAGGSP